MRRLYHDGELKSLREWAALTGVCYKTAVYRWEQGIRDFNMLFSGGVVRQPLRITEENKEWLEFTKPARAGMRNEWQIACELIGLNKSRAKELKAVMEGL